MFAKPIKLHRKKFNICVEIITCDPSIYTMNHPELLSVALWNIQFFRKGLTVLLSISIIYGQLKVRALTQWSSSQQESTVISTESYNFYDQKYNNPSRSNSLTFN